mgnify:CR=1 FL=1
MLIYTNGCSHTEGHNVDSIKTWPHYFIRGIIGQNFYETKPKKIINKNII